ncbi:histidine phosphatase family protein [Shewanella zhangzhouensis]|uniref:histidine phosphatase family protein n=1 Tax=Shewanella zhangzhouensis TaxID=2864213 RepID=UPI001C6603A8|nr:histidine phosphatase family protein [Shewanella zhangzhouensis]QYK05702.1 phosphoglycerate mutase family protein [Shewanella zhangzhouensis]
MPTDIFLLRHGQTEFNAQRRLQGHCDSPLTALGRAQARAYGQALRRCGNLDDYALLTSPLGRAMETAAIVADTLGRTPDSIIPEPRIKEAGLGEWEQEHIPDIHSSWPGLEAMPGWYIKGPGAEPLSALRERLLHWLEDPATPQKVILVSHGVTGVVLRGLLQNLGDDEMWRQDKPQDAFYYFSHNRLHRISC